MTVKMTKTAKAKMTKTTKATGPRRKLLIPPVPVLTNEQAVESIKKTHHVVSLSELPLSERPAAAPVSEPTPAPTTEAAAAPARPRKPATDWKIGQRFTREQLLPMVKQYATDHYDRDGWDFLIETCTDEEIMKAMGGARTFGGAVGMVQAGLGLKARAAHRAEIEAA